MSAGVSLLEIRMEGPVGRPRFRFKVDAKIDLKEAGCEDMKWFI
jgi:hypothetical protein